MEERRSKGINRETVNFQVLKKEERRRREQCTVGGRGKLALGLVLREESS